MVTAQPAPTGRRRRTMCPRWRVWRVSFAPSGRVGLTIQAPRVAPAVGGLHPWLQSLALSGRVGLTIQAPRVPAAKPAYTRGYSPSPLQGEMSRRSLCHAEAKRGVATPFAAWHDPNGVADCSHGCSEPPANVTRGIDGHSTARPNGAAGPLDVLGLRSWVSLLRPFRASRIDDPTPTGSGCQASLHPWLQSLALSGRAESTIQLPRVPAAKPACTRGYSPSPFQGESD